MTRVHDRLWAWAYAGCALAASLVLVGGVFLAGSSATVQAHADDTPVVDVTGLSPWGFPAPPLNGSLSPAGSWHQVFADEFEGAAIDRTRWRVNRFGGSAADGAFNPDLEGAFFAPRGVTVEDGHAVLRTRPETAEISGVAYTHSSGTVSSQDSFSLQDGDYVEARIFIPAGSGLWPTFWTIPADTWPPEIDIAEFIGTDVTSRPLGVYHLTDGSNQQSSYGTVGVDYRNSWHTYGMLRSGGRIDFFLDGRRYPEATVTSGADDLPQFLVFSLAMARGSNPDPAAAMMIDWVRAWRQ